MELGIKLINDPQTPLLQGHQDNRERGIPTFRDKSLEANCVSLLTVIYC